VPSSVSHVRLDRRAPVVFDPASAFSGLSAGELAALPSPLAVYDGSSSPPTCAANYCHGATLSGGRPAALAAPPAWSSAAPAVTDCTSCHGAPPDTGRALPADGVYCLSGCSVHAWHVQALPVLGYESCDACHHGSALGNAAALHVNGRVDVVFSAGITGSWDPVAGTCATACHSDPAPRSWR
jgi:predicted CxxxxCH...CXXCH cytochrome family protein